MPMNICLSSPEARLLRLQIDLDLQRSGATTYPDLEEFQAWQRRMIAAQDSSDRIS